MLKGLKITKPKGAAQPKKWQKDYTDVVTKDRLIKQHELIMKHFVEGEFSQLKSAHSELAALEEAYYTHNAEPTEDELFRLGEMPTEGQRSAPNQKYGSREEAYEQERPNNKQKRKDLAQQAYKFLPSPKVISNCQHCPQNGKMWIASSSQYFCLSIPPRKQFTGMLYYHLTPVEHLPSTLKLESDAYDQLNNYKKCLIQMCDAMNLHAIFFEAYHKNNSHLVIEVLAIPQNKSHDLPFFFKKGLVTAEGDWGTNKSIIEIKKEKGGLLKQIPRNFKYFYIDFSLGYGYAHLIEEEQQQWREEFAREILASMLGLEQHEVLSTEEYTEEELQRKGLQFQQAWKQFDWTTLL